MSVRGGALSRARLVDRTTASGKRWSSERASMAGVGSLVVPTGVVVVVLVVVVSRMVVVRPAVVVIVVVTVGLQMSRR